MTRRILAAADNADFDTILSYYDPNAIWIGRGMGSFEGVEAIRRVWQDYYGAFDEVRVQPLEVLDHGNGVILAVNEQTARMTGSTGHVRTREAFIYEWVDGKVLHVSMFGDVDEARAAAERLAEERA